MAASHSREGVTYWDNGSNDGGKPGRTSQLWLKRRAHPEDPRLEA